MVDLQISTNDVKRALAETFIRVIRSLEALHVGAGLAASLALKQTSSRGRLWPVVEI